MNIPDWIQNTYFGNTMWQYSVCFVLFLGILLGFYIARKFLLDYLGELARKTETDLDDLAVGLIARVQDPERVLLALYISTRMLKLPPQFDAVLYPVVVLVLAVRIITLLNEIAAYIIKRVITSRESSEIARAGAIKNMVFLVNGIIWVGGILFILSNLGFNISSMLTGLGIGGIAVALALQNVLGDLFSAVSIYLDKPFRVGDFIIFGDKMGTVEAIGVKTTRIRALSGEILVISNSILTSSSIQNYKHMSKRRINFKFGVVYQTSAAQLEKIPGMVKDIIGKVAKAEYNRCHFNGFGDSSLDFDIVYYVLVGDYNVYMDVHQEIILAIFKAFKKEKIDFAYPTQTLYIEKMAAPAAA